MDRLGAVLAAEAAETEATERDVGSDDPVGVTWRFYAGLFGWTIGGSGSPGYRMVDTCADRGSRGGLGSSQQARWATVYASVADVEQTLAKAETLCGSRVYGPTPVDDHMETGAFRDPAGNAFGVYHHGAH